jgi:hypothetical protein
MCECFGIGEVVDPNNLNVSPTHLNSAKEIATDSTKTVNANLHQDLLLDL